MVTPGYLRNISVVGARGFEPPTPCSQGRCAIQAAPRPVISSKQKNYKLQAHNQQLKNEQETNSEDY